jgi:prepilin-type N-terminal cleavage/methylation domain-containing protein
MNKKGFTLTELLVVIAIIGVLSVIIIPSVVKINESINEREYEQRVTYVQSAAEMYASDKPDIFAGGDVAEVYVWQLINEGYLTPDSNDDVCNYYKAAEGVLPIPDSGEARDAWLTVGCVSDPRESFSINSYKVRITKKTVGVVAELVDDPTPHTPVGGSELLIIKACREINNDDSKIEGRFDTNTICKCVFDNTENPTNVTKLVRDDTNAEVDSCIIVSKDPNNGNVDNWLKYGATTANWRVVGLYNLGGENGIVAKIVTSAPVD